MTGAHDVAGRIVVVGLGPAGTDLLVPAARTAIASTPHRFVRTARHPAVEELASAGLAMESFDDVYDGADSFDEVYATIAERVVGTARRVAPEAVVYAVPGHPLVAERSVPLVLELAGRDGVATEVVAGLSFADLAAARLGIDPADLRMVDARDLVAPSEPPPGPQVPAEPRATPSGPTLVAQADSRLLLGEVKLSLLDRLPPDAPVTVLQGLGRPDESVRVVALADLDRVVDPDHLTSLFVVAPPGIGEAVDRFAALVTQLRAPGGCPWDAAQTHHSLTRHLVEEAYEVVDAIDALPPDAPGGDEPPGPDDYDPLRDELGDLLYQVVLHAELAAEAGGFTLADVAEGIRAKLVHRHPHVYGGPADSGLDHPADADAVTRNWERIKQVERGGGSMVDGVPRSLPALLAAQKLLRKASSGGLDWVPGGAADPMAADGAAAVRVVDAEQLGEMLAAAVSRGREQGLDPEAALRGWIDAFRARFVRMEALAASRGLDTARLPPDAVWALWDESAP